MHKRAVQHIPELSSGFRHTFRRHRSGPGQGNNRSSTRLVDAPFDQRDRRRGKVSVAEELRKVLSPEACGWLEGKPFNSRVDAKGKSPARELLLPSRNMPPSQEQQQFAAMQRPGTTTILADGEVDASTDAARRIPAGTLVELRRSGLALYGTVLYSMLHNRKWVLHVLTNSGEVWQCFEHDVTFQIPDFIGKKLAELCGLFADARSEAEGDARVQVLDKLRSFEKWFEYDLHTIPELARSGSFYDQVVHPDPTTWAHITTREAAVKLFGQETTLTTQDLFAVQSFLFANGDLYVAETRRFLQKQLFWVRPRQEVADIQAVTDMVLRGSPTLDSFAEKARRVIAESRQRTADSWGEPPSRRPMDDLEWTDDEQTIFRFFLASMKSRRFIQQDPFLVPITYIMKRVGMHHPDAYDPASAHTFIIELGLVAPWEELNTRETLGREETDTVDLAPTVSTPILPSSHGPTDLYSQDVVESLRHDFGDMPVFVIDDWGAEELDDGISVERIPSDPEHTWLHVHVADPTTLLPPTHDIARQAMQLATAHYYVDRTIPMLPRDAGFHRFSLGGTPGQPDVVLTFSVKVNSNGEIVDYKVRPAIVRNVRTIKYDEVDALLGNEPVVTHFPFGDRPQPPQFSLSTIGPNVVDDLRLINEVARRLCDWRFRNNAFFFTLPSFSMAVEPRPLPNDIMGSGVPSQFRGFPKLTYSITHQNEAGSRGMISECMKTAGRVASLFFRDRGIPAIRRTVGPAQTELRGKIEELMASRAPGGIIDVYQALAARVTVPAGQNVVTPAMHSLLGIPEGEGYTKVTSPLRRFGDMIAHWQIKHALLAEKGERAAPSLFDADWLLRAAEDISMRELVAQRVEKDQQSFWAHSFLLRWMGDPRRAERERDPLRTLTARLTEPPTLYESLGEVNCGVYVPQLGLSARVIGLPLGTGSELTLGDEIGVDIHQVHLGPRPMLDMKRR
ncbi:RNB-domain-containing protein [Ganoderma leucocontextum]|nr:RNB-domain-containing protein [Ganoderma leucocontextum]